MVKSIKLIKQYELQEIRKSLLNNSLSSNENAALVKKLIITQTYLNEMLDIVKSELLNEMISLYEKSNIKSININDLEITLVPQKISLVLDSTKLKNTDYDTWKKYATNKTTKAYIKLK